MDTDWIDAVDSLETEIIKSKIENQKLEEELQRLKDEETFLKKKLNNLQEEEIFHIMESKYLNLTSSHLNEKLKISQTFHFIDSNLDQINEILNIILEEKENYLSKLKKRYDQRYYRVKQSFDSLTLGQESLKNEQEIFKKFSSLTSNKEHILDSNILPEIEKWRLENFTNNKEKVITTQLGQEEDIIEKDSLKQYHATPLKENQSDIKKMSVRLNNSFDNDNLEIVLYDENEDQNNSEKKGKKKESVNQLLSMKIKNKEREDKIETLELALQSSQNLADFEKNQNVSGNFFNYFENATQEEDFSFSYQHNEELTDDSFNFKF